MGAAAVELLLLGTDNPCSTPPEWVVAPICGKSVFLTVSER